MYEIFSHIGDVGFTPVQGNSYGLGFILPWYACLAVRAERLRLRVEKQFFTPEGCFPRQPYSLHFAQFLEHGGRVLILRIEREGFFVVLDGLDLVSRSHVGFAEAVVRVSRIRV